MSEQNTLPAEQNTIGWEQDADGIVTLTLDDPGQRANTMTVAYRQSMKAAVDRLYAEKDSITGVIVTSGKDTFFAGGDLRLLSQVTDATAEEFFAGVEAVKADLRRLETYGRPVVSALNGAALGGGLEIALATHHRVALDNPKSQFGLPEVTLGLLPGGGGVTRVVRLLGIADGLMKVLLQGQRLAPAKALELGLIDEIVPTREQMFANAAQWIRANPEAAQPWDKPGYKMPGGTPSNPKFAAILPAFPANLKKQLKGAPMPAPHHILCVAVEGAQVDIDTALRIESRYMTDLVRGQVAKNMIQAFWFDLNAINAGGQPPGRLRAATDQEGRGARRRHDGRGDRLRQCAQRHRGRPQGRLDRGGREGQGLFPQAARQGSVSRQADAAEARRGAGTHHADR